MLRDVDPCTKKPFIYKLPPSGSRNPLEEAKRILEEAQKVAGSLPAGLEEFLENPGIRREEWIKSVLKTVESLSSIVEVWPSWSIPNRRDYPFFSGGSRHPTMKGYRILGYPNVFALVDSSGSMGEEELKAAIGLVRYLDSLGALKAFYFFDVDVYDGVKNDLTEEKVRVFGRGGTDPSKGLELLMKESRPRDVVVLVTDGFWFGGVEAAERLVSSGRRLVIALTTKDGYEELKPLHQKAIFHVLEL